MALAVLKVPPIRNEVIFQSWTLNYRIQVRKYCSLHASTGNAQCSEQPSNLMVTTDTVKIHSEILINILVSTTKVVDANSVH